jgi:hypothetical protein
MREGFIRAGLLLVLSGCAGPGAHPPSVIVIHNSSERDLVRVTLREVDPSPEPARLGSISPVPIRPPDARALPGRIEVTWEGPEGPAGSGVIDLGELFRDPSARPDSALLIELGERGVLSARLTPPPPE